MDLRENGNMKNIREQVRKKMIFSSTEWALITNNAVECFNTITMMAIVKQRISSEIYKNNEKHWNKHKR
jgi:hypothetical protein